MKLTTQQDQEVKKWIRCRMCGEVRKKSDKNHICRIEYHLYKKFENKTKEMAKKSYKDWLKSPTVHMAKIIALNISLPHYEIWMDTFKNIPMVMKEMNKINKEYKQYEQHEEYE